MNCIEICAGAGGQALGLEQAGFEHVVLVEYENDYCKTLKQNRPNWNVICTDVKDFSGLEYAHSIDLFAGGIPCPPYGWFFGTKKTAACRMIGNAFPPPVAKAVGEQIKKVLEHEIIVSKRKRKVS